MFDEKKSLEMLNEFQTHYDYDTSYIKGMLKSNINAYKVFEGFLPMASFIEKSSPETVFLVKLVVMKNEDCGACLQLNINMAIEAGVDKNIINEVIFNEGKNLPKDLKDLYTFALKVAKNEPINDELYDKINNKYDDSILVEIALAAAAAKVFPTIKRVLNNIKSCSMIQIKV